MVRLTGASPSAYVRRDSCACSEVFHAHIAGLTLAREHAFWLRIRSQAELRLTKLNGPQLAGYPLGDRHTMFRGLAGTRDPGRDGTGEAN
jgi:hypothetical protein